MRWGPLLHDSAKHKKHLKSLSMANVRKKETKHHEIAMTKYLSFQDRTILSLLVEHDLTEVLRDFFAFQCCVVRIIFQTEFHCGLYCAASSMVKWQSPDTACLNTSQCNLGHKRAYKFSLNNPFLTEPDLKPDPCPCAFSLKQSPFKRNSFQQKNWNKFLFVRTFLGFKVWHVEEQIWIGFTACPVKLCSGYR